jgi:hypothetical protein
VDPIERAHFNLSTAEARAHRARFTLQRSIELLRAAEIAFDRALLDAPSAGSNGAHGVASAKASYDDALALARIARDLETSARQAAIVARAHLELCLSRARHEQADAATPDRTLLPRPA